MERRITLGPQMQQTATTHIQRAASRVTTPDSTQSCNVSASADGSRNPSLNQPLDVTNEHSAGTLPALVGRIPGSSILRSHFMQQYDQQLHQEQRSFEDDVFSDRPDSPRSAASDSRPSNQLERPSLQRKPVGTPQFLCEMEEVKQGEHDRNEQSMSRTQQFHFSSQKTPGFRPHESDSAEDLQEVMPTLKTIQRSASKSTMQPREIHLFSHHCDTGPIAEMALRSAVETNNYDRPIILKAYTSNPSYTQELSSLRQALKKTDAVIVFETNLGKNSEDAWVADRKWFEESAASVVLFNGGDGNYPKTKQMIDALQESMGNHLLGYFTNRSQLPNFYSQTLVRLFKKQDESA